jgi:two-component system, NarL family, sensor histidine kinase DevS
MEVGRGLVSNLELEVVLNRLVEVARELTGAQYAALGILDEDRRELERFITVGIDEELRAAIGALPRGHGVLGELIRDPKPLRLENVGDHPRSYGFPASHPPMKTFLGVPVMIRGVAFGNLYLTEKQGGPFDESDEEAAMILADFAAIAIENARLFTQAQSRQQDLERAVRRLEATTEIARALDGAMELSHMLELIAKRGRAIVDARWIVIFLVDDEELEVAAAAGALDSGRVGTRLDREETIVDEVIRRGPRRGDLSGPLAEALGTASITDEPALFLPLAFRGTTYGMLVAGNERADGEHLSSEDARLLEAFAAAAANAISTTRSVAADRLRHSIEASERERRRWARELHDETLQGLGGLQVLLSSAVRRPSEDLAEAVRNAVAQLTEDIASLRSLITELRPAALDELGLVPAIETLAQRTASTEGLMVETNIELELEARERLDPELESNLYRLAQEALTNVVKHAAASRIEIGLVLRDGAIVLSVSDDGGGFDPDDAHGGFGLVGMRERVALAGGRLEISSEPGRGTTLQAELPAPSHRQAPAGA